MSRDRPCEHCDSPDSSLLRVVLIGEIIRADDHMLYTLVDICETLGLLEFAEDIDEALEAEHTAKPSKPVLRRIK